jgi:YHS domain-containing protein
MQTPAPTLRPPRTLTLGRGWLLPAGLVALILAGSYLPAHGVAGLLNIAAATIVALGLVAASLAAPRWIRGVVTGRSGSLPLLGSEPLGYVEPTATARRRVVAVALGAAVSAAGTAAFAMLLVTTDPVTAAHAVMVIALYANVALLLSNVTPVPPWLGWQLLLALVDARGVAAEDRVDRAVPIARGVITAEAAAVAAVAASSSDWMLLVLAAWLVGQGWMQTAIARADNAIHRYLTVRRLGDVARELSTTASPDEPALLAATRRPSDRALIAVMDGDGFLGAIGPRQAAAVPPTAPGTACGDVMIPVERIELLRPEAPAASALAQLNRFGFALVTSTGRLSYVEVDDLLQRIQMNAAVVQAVRADSHASAPKKNPKPQGKGGPPMFTSAATQVDPVCGMAVDPPAGVSLQWEGRDYRFCDVACRDTFQDDPARWAEPLKHVDEPVPHS